MKKFIIISFSISALAVISIIWAKPTLAECGVAPEIGCKYYFGNADCSEIWGARHTCYPPPQFKVCGCDDCQGPRGDRCGGKPADDSTPTPTPALTSTPTPTLAAAPTSLPIQFMGIKLGRLSPAQPLQIIWDIIRKIIGW